jgi:hypothetical protein
MGNKRKLREDITQLPCGRKTTNFQVLGRIWHAGNNPLTIVPLVWYLTTCKRQDTNSLPHRNARMMNHEQVVITALVKPGRWNFWYNRSRKWGSIWRQATLPRLKQRKLKLRWHSATTFLFQSTVTHSVVWTTVLVRRVQNVVHVDGVRLSLNCSLQRTCYSYSRWYMSMELRWHDTDRGNLRKVEKNLSRFHFACHKSHMNWPRISRRKAGD